MKKIEAIIRKSRFEDVKEALLAADIEWFSYYDVRGEGEDAAEVVEKVDALLAIQCQYNLAVAARLKLIFPLEAFSDVLMVIYLAVYGQHLFLIGGEEGLTSRLGVDNAQSFMAQDGRSTCIDAAPVGSAVTNFLTHT